MTEGPKPRIGLVGYGEVGKILGRELVERGAGWVGAWDLLLRDPQASPAMEAHARDAGVETVTSLAALLAAADVVISAVTASQAQAVAEEAAPAIRAGTWFLDLNSASPGVKASSGELIDGAGGRFVEAAVMTSVPPYGVKVPMLLGGSRAYELRMLLAPLGFEMEVIANRLGVASAIKMCRSVIIKGMEALFVESLITARVHGVEKPVLESLQETFPGVDWQRQASYFFSRVAEHGKRRAEEMREVALTVREAGLEPWMASATAQRQEWVAGLKGSAALAQVAKGGDWREYADRLIAALPS